MFVHTLQSNYRDELPRFMAKSLCGMILSSYVGVITNPGNDHTSPTSRQFWVDDLPAFPFGGICDRSLEGPMECHKDVFFFPWLNSFHQGVECWGQLSGGQKSKMMLAAAAWTKPHVTWKKGSFSGNEWMSHEGKVQWCCWWKKSG